MPIEPLIALALYLAIGLLIATANYLSDEAWGRRDRAPYLRIVVGWPWLVAS